MKYNYKADQMRLAASIAVVLIHVTSYLPNFDRETLINYYWYRPFLNIGVPFFFGVSGYLISKKGHRFISRYCQNIGLKFLVYSIFYTVLDLVMMVSKHMDVPKAIAEWWDQRNLYSLINGTWGQYHLWFLFALMISAYLYDRFRKNQISNQKLFAVMMIFNILIWTLPKMDLIDQVFRYGGILKALLYLSMGAYIAHRQPGFVVTKWHIILMAVIYAVLFNFSPFAILNELGLTAVTYLLLDNIIHRPGHETWLNQWSSMSLDIYVLHVLFLKLVEQYGAKKLWSWFNSDLLYIMVLMLISVIGSIAMYPIINRWFFNPLQKGLKLVQEE